MASDGQLQGELKWLGSPIENHFGTIAEIRKFLPTFVRRPFSTVSVDGANDLPSNAFLDVIVRQPLEDENEEIPVGVVSKQYQLVQHAEVLDKAIQAIEKAGIAPDTVNADLTITKYGERVGLHLQFPEKFGLDPGDGHHLALRLGCFNSVDGSTKFRAVLGWIRFVCSNGMIVGSAQTDYRSRHTQSLQVLQPDDLPSLNKFAERVQELAAQVGVAPRQEYRPKLDVKSVSIGAGGVTLHDGNVPVRKAGLGTRRLLSLALKREAAKLGGVTLIDEVEHGLEPHRIRRLLHFLKTEGGEKGQAFVSTHSPVVLTELSATDLRIVRSNDGKTEVLSAGEELQFLIRKAPDALLGNSL